MYKMIIDGQKVEAIGLEKLDVISPVDGNIFTQIPRGKSEDIDAAVKAARKAYSQSWKNTTALERGRLLMKLGEKVLENFDELALLESKDTGKPIGQAQNDIKALARYFEFYGSGADKVHGDVIPFMQGYSVQVIREPLGVTAHIIPWNYPAQMAGRSVAPALAMGNAVVVKPAEDACLSIIRLAELALEVGIPAGVFNVVTGLGEEAGAALAAHSDINYISFTGSNEVGTFVQKAAAENAVKCTLELGGKSAHVVFNDVDFKVAIPAIINGIIQNSGQTCTAGSRLLIQEEIYDDFIQELSEQFSKTCAGHPDKNLNCGPVISKIQFDRVNHFIELGRKEKLSILAEGSIDNEAPKEGYYIKPILFGAQDHSSELLMKEIFGPVLVALPFKTEEEAIELANCTEYGLMAAVWSENGNRQMRVAKALESGQVYINGFGAGGGIELPFGGVKRSGHGREKGFIALEEVSTTKTIIHNHG